MRAQRLRDSHQLGRHEVELIPRTASGNGMHKRNATTDRRIQALNWGGSRDKRGSALKEKNLPKVRKEREQEAKYSEVNNSNRAKIVQRRQSRTPKQRDATHEG